MELGEMNLEVELEDEDQECVLNDNVSRCIGRNCRTVGVRVA
ncbi:unnamed protein product [Wuchereria bancrofti]|uniref:Uncharacterized protein n=1 Tax=Wuchereria bancrofti TaxID=6293 RepID=A0A3P7G500_WUCBA|nr:unnamed protein product [Wuchereria bancrofti]